MKSEWWDEIFDDSYERFRVAFTRVVYFLFAVRVLISIMKNIDLVFSTPYFQMSLTLFSLCATINIFRKKSRMAKKVVLYILVEMINIVLKVLAFYFFPKDSIILSLGSTLVTLFYQSNIFESTWPHAIIAIKHIVLWYLIDANLIVSKNFTSPIGIQVFIVILWVTFESQNKAWLGKLFYSRDNEKEIRHQFSEILRVFPDGLLIVNCNFDVKFMNESTKHIFGKSNSGLMNELLEIKLVDSEVSIVEMIKNNGFQINTVIKSLGITNINNLIYEWTITQVKWEEENCCMIILKDVTKILSLERSASENKTKAYIIKSVSHDLRTPVNAIMLLIEKLLIKFPIKYNKKLAYIKICANLLKFQINDILDYTKIISDQFILNYTKCDIKKYLKECSEFVTVQAAYKGIKIINKIDNLIPDECVIDAYRIQKVVMNLLNNAVKYTNKGRIELSAIHTGHGVKITVKDTGTGIPETRLKQIFDMLNGNSQSCLSGLGLYISKKILQKMNSSIKVESDPGKGSSFSFILNIFDPIEHEHTETDVPDEKVSCLNLPHLPYRNIEDNTIQILIVDDNDFNRLCLASILKSKGILFLEAVNGEEAINTVTSYDKKGQSIKCIIMDCNMPVIDGWEASRQIRNFYSQGIINYQPAVIGYTAYSSEEDIQKCFDSGMVSYLIKPTTHDAILSLITKYIN
ncbi:hypothetical protein SteCoe_26893 [Stentor coeruleus]|uniref:histidine kinase n=1 Tax=Stentor coeruleus TaxID=5963 RepID=A0A1R2BBU0_9CILI|nr:hypothetical protein SteCoe_26893 [Stentor coeruleus]